jgi:hypothetical protein
MAKQPARKKTAMDEWAIAAGSTLGKLVAKIDKLTARRSEISAEIQHYVRQAEGALKKATATEAAPAAPKKARKRAAKKSAAKKTAAKARKRA